MKKQLEQKRWTMLTFSQLPNYFAPPGSEPPIKTKVNNNSSLQSLLHITKRKPKVKNQLRNIK